MSNQPWHKRYHSDALAGYMDLTLEEAGAYSILLDMLYDRGEPVVHNERLLAGFWRVSVRRARALVEALEAKGKIILLADGRITNRRFEKERADALKKSRKHAENGVKSARVRAERRKTVSKNNADASARLEPYQKPEARSQKPEEESSPPPPGDSPACGGGGGFAASAEADRREHPPPSEREQVLAAMGVGPDGILGASCRLSGTEVDVAELRRWRGDLALGLDQVLAVVGEVMATRPDPDPPARWSYFTAAMRRLARVRDGPVLTPLAGGRGAPMPVDYAAELRRHLEEEPDAIHG